MDPAPPTHAGGGLPAAPVPGGLLLSHPPLYLASFLISRTAKGLSQAISGPETAPPLNGTEHTQLSFEAC